MIKILACIFMIIDHIGLIFFPQHIVFRIVGRLSMPLFAYCIARGIRNTHNIKKYFYKVILIAVVSQIPYMFLVNKLKLNICFLWAVSIILIYGYKTVTSPYMRVLLVSAVFLGCSFLPLDYGLYGLLYVIIMYLYAFQKNDIKTYGAWTVLHLAKLFVDFQGGIIQIFTLPTISIVDICNRYGFEKIKKYNKILTWFYPVHIVFLLLIKYILHKV